MSMEPFIDQALPDGESPRRILETVLNHVNQGISYFNRDMALEVCNRRYLELLDFPLEMAVPGTPFEAFIRFNAERGEYGPGNVDELVEARLDNARKQEAHRFERTRPSDGTTLEIIGTPLADGGFVTTYADITERKFYEARIEEAQHQLVLALEGADLGMWDWDLTTHRIKSNPRFKQMLGLPPDIEVDNDLLFAMLHPDDRTDLRDALSAHFKGLVGHFESEHRSRQHGDGRWIWLLVRGKVMARDAADRALRVVGTALDITERKRNEALLLERERRLATLARSMQDMIVVLDPDGKIIEYWPSPTFHLANGIGSMVGQQYASVLPAPLVDGIGTGIVDIYWDHASHRFDIDLEQPGGQAFYQVTMSRLTDASQNLTGFLVLVRDITEVRQLHKALSEAKPATEGPDAG